MSICDFNDTIAQRFIQSLRSSNATQEIDEIGSVAERISQAAEEMSSRVSKIISQAEQASVALSRSISYESGELDLCNKRMANTPHTIKKSTGRYDSKGNVIYTNVLNPNFERLEHQQNDLSSSIESLTSRRQSCDWIVSQATEINNQLNEIQGAASDALSQISLIITKLKNELDLVAGRAEKARDAAYRIMQINMRNTYGPAYNYIPFIKER